MMFNLSNSMHDIEQCPVSNAMRWADNNEIERRIHHGHCDDSVYSQRINHTVCLHCNDGAFLYTETFASLLPYTK